MLGYWALWGRQVSSFSDSPGKTRVCALAPLWRDWWGVNLGPSPPDPQLSRDRTVRSPPAPPQPARCCPVLLPCAANHPVALREDRGTLSPGCWHTLAGSSSQQSGMRGHLWESPPSVGQFSMSMSPHGHCHLVTATVTISTDPTIHTLGTPLLASLLLHSGHLQHDFGHRSHPTHAATPFW